MMTALVTGANKRLGFGVAGALGGMGIKVWLGAREESRGLAAAAQSRAGGADAEYLATVPYGRCVSTRTLTSHILGRGSV